MSRASVIALGGVLFSLGAGCEHAHPPVAPQPYPYRIMCQAQATGVCVAAMDMTDVCIMRDPERDPYVPERLVGIDDPCGHLLGLPSDPSAESQGQEQCEDLYCGCLDAGLCDTCEVEFLGWGDTLGECTPLPEEMRDGTGRTPTRHPACVDAGVFDGGDGGDSGFMAGGDGGGDRDAGDAAPLDGGDAGDAGDGGDAGPPVCPDAGPVPPPTIESGTFQILSYEWGGGSTISAGPTVILNDVPAEFMETDTVVPHVIMAARELLYLVSPNGHLAGFDFAESLHDPALPTLDAAEYLRYGPFDLRDFGIPERVTSLRVFNAAYTEDDWAIIGTQAGVYLVELADPPVVHATPATTGGNLFVRAVGGNQFLVDRSPPSNVWTAFVSEMPPGLWVTTRLGAISPTPSNLDQDPTALAVAERVQSTAPPDLWTGEGLRVEQWLPAASTRESEVTYATPVVGLVGGECVDATINDFLMVALDHVDSTELVGYLAGDLASGSDTRITRPGRFVGLTSECIGDVEYDFLSTSRAGTVGDTLRILQPAPDTGAGTVVIAARELPAGLLSIGFTTGLDPGEPGPPEPGADEEPEPPEGSTMFLHVAVQRLDSL